MKHASFTAAVSFFCGSLFFWVFPQAFSPSIWILVAFLLLASLLFFIHQTRWLRDLLLICCCLLITAFLLWIPVSNYYDTAETYDGKTVTATVILTEDPVLTSGGTYRYVVRPGKELFSQKFVFFSATHYGNAGDQISGTFTFEKPEKEYLLENISDGVVLTALMDSFSESVTVEEGKLSFYSVSGAVRRYVYKTFLRFIGDDEGGFMTAVLTGNKRALSSNDYDVLQQTGMLHIVAVSGLHVSVFVSFVLFLLKKMRKLRIKIVLSVLSLGIVLLFSGFTPSVCRAIIMNLIVFGGEWFARRTDSLNRLGIAAILILLVSPYTALSLSFQLSFSATLGILLFSTPFTRAVQYWLFVRRHIICGSVLRDLVSLFCMSLAAFIVTLPLSWFLLDSYSTWSLYLSPVILPILQISFSIALILLILSFAPFLFGLCKILGLLIRFGVNFMTYLSTFATSIMDMVETVPNSLKWVVVGVALILAGFLFFLPAVKTSSKRKKRQNIRKGLSLVLAVIALLTAYQASESAFSNLTVGEVAPAENVLQTAFLDVGQGNCFITLLNKEAYVVDCGGTKDPGIVAADYLTAAGIDTVKFVLISHLHDDHANGLSDLCAEKEILEIIIPYTEGDAGLYAEIVTLAAEEGAVLTVIEEDTSRTIGNSTLRLLTKHLDPTSEDQNENSIVGLCEYGNFRALFTGDITTKAEKRLVSSYGNALDCDVLSIPHHGSKSSSSTSFLKACSPVYAVISVGAKNTYGHPTEEAMNRISDLGATMYRTDKLSTVTVRTDGEVMEVLSANET